MTGTAVTLESLVQGLRHLGLEVGMGVMVHSSLRSFGYVEGGPATVVDALMTAITPAGTLMLPSFNHDVPFRPGGPGVYDPLVTPTTNGAIPDDFWRRPGVSRSLNPTHPFAAWGVNAETYTTAHHRTLTMGPDSPLGLMCRDDGYVLLLGVDYASNTFHHCVEMSTGAPCLGLRTEAYPVRLAGGRRVVGRTWGWRGGHCPFTDGNRYADRMADKQRVVTIGACRATLYRMADCFVVVSDILTNGRDGRPPCRGCPIRPRRVAATVASDWDATADSLKPNAEALTY